MQAKGAILVLALVTVAAGGCDRLGQGLSAGSLECDGTEPALCQAVARVAIAQMNLTATGPITQVTLERIPDCAAWARSNFMSDLAEADACWTVVVTGERSRGWGTVGQWADGSLRAFWQ